MPTVLKTAAAARPNFGGMVMFIGKVYDFSRPTTIPFPAGKARLGMVPLDRGEDMPMQQARSFSPSNVTDIAIEKALREHRGDEFGFIFGH